MDRLNKKRINLLIFLGVVFVSSFFLLPFIGARWIEFGAIMDFSEAGRQSRDHIVFWSIRLPRVLNTLIAGAALSLSGMALQALFRNPLATPFTLGISAGAGLGAVIGIKLNLDFRIMGVSSISILAFTGALLTVFLVYGLTQMRKGFSLATMLLAGVAVNFFFLALIVFVQYLADFTEAHQMIRWMMGSLETIGFRDVLGMAPLTIIGAGMIYWIHMDLNLLLSGEDIARSRGVEVNRVKLIAFLASSLMTGSVVAVCGPISFVGLIVPHILRLLIGGSHLHLTTGCILFGGVFLAFCDSFARLIISPAEIPVGIITALLGAPFFLWLLLKK